jgi:hypothetical protein
MKRLFKRRQALKGRNKNDYRLGWRFPPIIEQEIRKWVISPSLHVCSGQSTLGDVKIDLFQDSDIRADMGFLPILPSSFASVIWDAPYVGATIWKTRPTLAELALCLRIGGRLIALHYMDPSNYLKRTMKLIWKAYYEPKEFRGLRVLTVMEKLPNRRIAPRSREILVPVPVNLWEPQQLQLVASKAAGSS